MASIAPVSDDTARRNLRVGLMAFAGALAMLGGSHPETRAYQRNLARGLRRAGRLAEARAVERDLAAAGREIGRVEARLPGDVFQR